MIKDEAKRLGLYAPCSFWAMDEATLAMITGGCGPGAVGNFGWFDSMWGLDIRPACAIHDYEYGVGTTREQKKAADMRMLANMYRIINRQSKSWILRVLRRYRATSYYNAVAEGGWSAFVDATVVDAAVTVPRPAPWYDAALREMRSGVTETPGVVHNPRIIEYHQATNLMAKTDEVAWCSSFVNWCMLSSGVTRTNKANARSWLSWGSPIDKPRIGCVVVFKRGVKAWQGHVGFYAGRDAGGGVLCLGGNQKNKVCISTYPNNKVLGYRWAELKQG